MYIFGTFMAGLVSSYCAYMSIFRNMKQSIIHQFPNKIFNSNVISLQIGDSIMRLPCHRFNSDMINIVASGSNGCGSESIHLEFITGHIVGLPVRPADIGYDRIIVSYTVDGDVETKTFYAQDAIKLISSLRQLPSVDISDDDSDFEFCEN